jgi:regulator of sigma E protease
MLEKVLIFIVFLAPLIFFHELGHFFFARFFGVRVEVFSIGFGPKIFKYVRHHTQYAISIIPLGGYVKMFGDDPFSEVPLSEEEKKVAFNQKSKWARFWIVFGGPLANLILAYFLYVGLLAGGEKVPETKIGQVAEESILYKKGLRSGDILVGINDEKILSFDDLNIKGSVVEKVVVDRSGKKVEVPVGLKLEPFIQLFIEIVSPLKKPLFINKKGEKFLLTLNQKTENPSASFEEINASFKGRAYLYKLIENKGAPNKIDLNSESEIVVSKDQSLSVVLENLEFYPLELMVKNVVMSSPADKVQLKKGDILLSLGGKKLNKFEELRQNLQSLPENQEIVVEFLSQGNVVKKSLLPEIKEIDKKQMKLIGIESSIEYVQPKLIEVRTESFSEALLQAFHRTYDGILKTFGGYKKLITREVSLNNIGGPLAIGKVASDSFNISLSMFFRLMAIISINLGVINLFPIPVLDGGHIVFLFLELINGGPLSRRKLEIAQRFGMSILFFLIFVALFNDITKLF